LKWTKRGRSTFTGSSNRQRALIFVQEELEEDAHVEEANAQAAHLHTGHVHRTWKREQQQLWCASNSKQ
jgi:hypothetical protein